jgi:hypothetical protein
MNIELTLGDVIQYLEVAGYSEKDILVMIKEPFYSITKRQLEANIRAQQEIAMTNNIVADSLELLKSR